MLHGVLSQNPQSLDTLRGGLKLQNPLKSRVCFGLIFHVVSVIHKKAKAKYKYAARRLLRCQNYLRREVLADALCFDFSRDFWTEVKHFEG